MTHLIDDIFAESEYKFLRHLFKFSTDADTCITKIESRSLLKKIPSLCSGVLLLVEDAQLWKSFFESIASFRVLRLRHAIFGRFYKGIIILHKRSAKNAYEACKKYFRKVFMYSHSGDHKRIVVTKKLGDQKADGKRQRLSKKIVSEKLDKHTGELRAEFEDLGILVPQTDELPYIVAPTDVPSPVGGPNYVEVIADVHVDACLPIETVVHTEPPIVEELFVPVEKLDGQASLVDKRDSDSAIQTYQAATVEKFRPSKAPADQVLCSKRVPDRSKIITDVPVDGSSGPIQPEYVEITRKVEPQVSHKHPSLIKKFDEITSKKFALTEVSQETMSSPEHSAEIIVVEAQVHVDASPRILHEGREPVFALERLSDIVTERPGEDIIGIVPPPRSDSGRVFDEASPVKIPAVIITHSTDKMQPTSVARKDTTKSAVRAIPIHEILDEVELVKVKRKVPKKETPIRFTEQQMKIRINRPFAKNSEPPNSAAEIYSISRPKIWNPLRLLNQSKPDIHDIWEAPLSYTDVLKKVRKNKCQISLTELIPFSVSDIFSKLYMTTLGSEPVTRVQEEECEKAKKAMVRLFFLC